MEKIAIITSGFLPVPATKGGAVENLIVNVLRENEKYKKVNFEVFSIFDEEAYSDSVKYKYTNFRFIKKNKIINLVDNIIFFIAKELLKKENSQSYRYIMQRLYFLNRCSRFLKANNYDKVVLENHPTQYLALKWRKNYKKYSGKYYYHCHNEFPETYKCDKIIKDTKKIICVSQFIESSISNCIDVPKEQFVVLKNCIDTSRFSKMISNEEKKKMRKKYGIGENDKILLFAGRITPEKGVKEVVESLKYIKYTNYKLLILGSALNELKIKTEYQERIEKMVKSMSNKIIFTGFISYEEINKFYALADIAVLPSIGNDSAPLTVIESLVSGLPIVTTNSGGIPEYAINGSAIILQRDSGIVKNLGENLDLLLNDDNKLKKMSQIAREVSENLTLDNYYNNFIKIMSDK